MALEEIVSAAFGVWRTRHRPRLQSLGLYAGAALLAMLGALYLSYAVFLALAEQAGPPVAAALTSALLLLLAILLVLVAVLINRVGRRREPETDEVALAEVLLRVGESFGHKIERPATTLAVTALVAGLVAGISPTARRFLLNLADQLFKEIGGEPK
jgi:MFS family permease